MFKVSHSSRYSASTRLARVVSHLNQAGKELSAATGAAPDHYHQQQLHNILLDLRGLSGPLAGLVTSLERGERQ